MIPTYRCPRADCGHLFHDDDVTPGTVTPCPGCGRHMNARPVAMEDALREREATIRGGAGADVPRLPLAVVADDIRSLWNVGSIFRTADACGVEELVLCGITGCPPRVQIDKTALGGTDAVRWRYRARATEALTDMEAAGYETVALESGPGGVSLPDMDWPARTSLVIGNEVRGLSPDVLEACRHRVSIPMRGVKDTLNVAVAFGIAAWIASEKLSVRSDS